MNWNEFKKVCKTLRKQSDIFTKKYGTQIWCTFNIWINSKSCIEINPYCPNLITGYIDITRDLISGKYLHDINIKECLKNYNEQ